MKITWPSHKATSPSNALPPLAWPTAYVEVDPLRGKSLLPDTHGFNISRSALIPALRPPQGGKPPLRRPSARLPPENYTIVYRPRDSLNVAKLNTHELTDAFAGKCDFSRTAFYNLVTLIIQPTNNMIVASTAEPELAIVLSNIQTRKYSMEPAISRPT